MTTILDPAMTVEHLPPELLSPLARAREAAAIIVAAVARLHATIPPEGEVSLGFLDPKRLHTTPSP